MAGNDDLISGPEATLTESASVAASISPEARAKADELRAYAAREISAAAQKEAEIKRLMKDRDDWRRVAQGQTPGGSEFTTPAEVAAYCAKLKEEHIRTIDSFKSRAATALAERDATIERLTKGRDKARRFCSAAYHDLVGLFETIKEHKDLFPRTTHDLIETSEFMKLATEGLADGTVYDDELSKEKTRATTLERERDEVADIAKKLTIGMTDLVDANMRLCGQLAESRAEAKAAQGERDEARAEVERVWGVVSTLAHLSDSYKGLPDTHLAYISVGTLRRAALTAKGGENAEG
ncbi:hypothetical protein EZH22_24705 [Xanthobacter dioxanivorans]|uniref:Uncharacterized protein n=1 Tax=Xanthobacter dioxanivorans TaxID=2528964 RepID=A0A974PM59_9HYPH|nr:hypothetical protein [Xanthobacter dioxanivorans]QRG06150.1 hypothetical protein EZH22_24705 [Xanthobacter dioxanivorans]